MSLRRSITLVASVISLQASALIPVLFPSPAFAIPKNEAIAKLKNIVVYVITSSKDEFVFSQRDDLSIVKVFMTKDSALSELAAFQKSDRMFRGSLQRYTLDDLYPIIESTVDTLTESSPRKFIFPIVNEISNTDKAREILLSQGVPEDVITKNLRVPVFYTEPMINMTYPGKSVKQMFFTEYSVLEDFLSKLNPRRRPKIKVLNLDQVLEIIIDERKDMFGIYPNAQYLSESD